MEISKKAHKETQLQNDPLADFNNDEVLQNAFDKNYKLYDEFIVKLNEINLNCEWRFYKDGGWLGKVMYKKKNLCWVFIENTILGLNFLFTEKTINGVYELQISDNIKSIARETKPTGKFHSIQLLVMNKKVLSEAIKLLAYKMTLK